MKSSKGEDGKEGEDDAMIVDEEMAPQNIAEEVADKNQHDLQMQEEPDECFEYKLVGVVLHMGTADAGHYLSYINTNRNSNNCDKPEWLLTDKDKWLEFNDS